MVVNNNKNNTHVEFVSYTGKYPNLCRGVLTLLIDSEEVRFGHDYSKIGSYESDGNYDSFWESGGNCGFRNNYQDSYVNSGEWVINAEDIPDKYRKYAEEIDDVFNSCVDYGCCGGCL